MADESPEAAEPSSAKQPSNKRKKRGKKPTPARAKEKSGGGRRPYPAVTLNRALLVPQKIKELNGGNPWASAEVAKAVEMGARSTNFYYLTAASRDFGFTLGSRETERIELTDLGRAVVYAPDEETEREKKKEAFLRVEIFRKVLEHYKGSTLPEMKYLGNTLEHEFGLAPEYHEEFSRLFRQNCDELGIITGEAADDRPSPRGPAVVVLGEQKTGDKKKLRAFIIMPFVEKTASRSVGFFSEVLRSLLTPAGVAAGFTVETANKQGSDIIQSTIINDLLEADLVIADLTDHNPNVLFELGVRMAEDKPVALIKASETGRIFDVDNMLRVYEYNANLWQSTIEKDLPELTEHIKAAWENRSSDQSYMKILRRGPKT
jgi:hypothetical protein